MQFNYLLPLLSIASIAAGQSVPDLATVCKNTPAVSQLCKLVTSYPDLLATLTAAKNITILAPNDAAFNKFLDMDEAKGVTQEAMKALLSYHVLNGTYQSTAFDETPKFLPSIVGEYQPLRNLGDAPQVVKAQLMGNNATVTGGLDMRANVVTADVKFNGGVVHIVDSLLAPPMNITSTAKFLGLTSLTGALEKAGLVHVDHLVGVTVFAPNNNAFQAIGNLIGNLTTDQLLDILEYHVVADVAYSTSLMNDMELDTVKGEILTITVDGDQVFVNGARVIKSDVLINSGVIHVIDGVLNPNNTDDKPEPSASTQDPAFASATSSPDEPFTSGGPDSTTTGASPSATGGVGKLGVSTVLVVVGAGVFAFGMMA